MKLFLLLSSLALSSAQQCSDTPVQGQGFNDPSPAKHTKSQSADDCCNECADFTGCAAWTYHSGGLFDEGHCTIHSSADLPTEKGNKLTSAKHAAPAPAPAPAPAGPPSPAGAGQNWVVIAAGSKTYGNYRHQADACHAYQIAKKGGVPESNIILMMEDDIANDEENPFPGKMFNKPSTGEGYDVYDGCEIDYKGSVVTAKLFLDVIQGKSDAVNGLGSGKVLKSGPNDKVFINFADHGGTGIIEFPNGDFLHASDLNTALSNMHSNNMYKKLVFYMEACESGSMFENLLPKNINIYATTAANAQESSWGTYCPPQDKVNGKEMNSCLGDLYSVNWMEDADLKGRSRTLEADYTYIKQVTNKSHVMQYGSLAFDQTDTLGDYVGKAGGDDTESTEDEEPAEERQAIDTHDVELLLDFYKYFRAEKQGKTLEEKQALADELVALIQARQLSDQRFAKLPEVVAAMEPDFEAVDTTDAECVKSAYNQFRETCGDFDSYTLKYTHQIADLCLTYSSDSIQTVLTTLCE